MPHLQCIRHVLFQGLACAVLWGAAPLDLRACTQPPPQPPAALVDVQGNTAFITVLGYTSFGSSPGQFCACALKQVGPILAINGLQVFNATNGIPLPGFTFQPYPATTAFFNTSQGGNWGGFLSVLMQNIPAGIPLRLVFVVTVAPGTSTTQLAATLASQGRIGTDEARPNGEPTGGHLAVLPFGPVNPASVGLAVLPGFTAIANNFNYPVNNTVAQVLPNVAPDTLLYKFSAVAQIYEPVNQFDPDLGGWTDPSQTLNPGEGAWLFSVLPQTLRFAGEPPPSPPARPRPPAGYYLVGCPTPAPADFEVLMGFPPQIGDRVYKYDGIAPALPGPAQSPSSVHAFGPGGWDVAPVLQPGRAAFVQLAGAVQVPVITMHPQSQTVPQGSPATFLVQATGTPPLFYQWRRNTMDLPGQRQPALAISNAAPSHEGTYDVVVSNGGGSATSQPATLTVLRSNTPPALDPISPQAVHADTPVQFMAVARDPDLPPNQLSFSLDPGAPPTAFIDPVSGTFFWTPTDEDAEQIHQMTVRVTDNGTPAQSATQLVSIVVMPRPEMSIALANDIVTLTWASIPGITYRVLFAPTITGPWNGLGADVTATNTTSTKTDQRLPTLPGRFYRITTTTTNPPVTNRFAFCLLLKRVVRGAGLTADSVAPAMGETTSMMKEKIPLIVKGADRDQLIQTCVCISLEGICWTSRDKEIMDSVNYAWRLTGDGTLMGTGPAVLYEPRDLRVGETNLATIEAEISDSRGNDVKATNTYTIKIVREDDCRYKRTVTIVSVVVPAAPVVITPTPCDCTPKDPVWAVPPPLTGSAPDEITVCAGERVVLNAAGSDADTLVLECVSASCGNPMSKPVLIDEMRYTWSAMRGSFPDHGATAESNSRRTSAIYLPPGVGGEDEITVKIQDSGAQAADAMVEKKIKVKVVKVDLQVDGVSEEEEECKGKLLCENDDDDDENRAHDNSDNAITGTDAQKTADKADMAKLTLKKLQPDNLPAGKVFVKKLLGAGNVRLFKDSDNSHIHTTSGAASSTTDAQATALFATLKAGDETYLMEGVDPGELFLALEYTDGKVTCRDVIRVVVISIEFVRDGMNDHAVDHTDPAITHANIGHWGADMAFPAGSGGGSGNGVDGYKADGTLRNDASPDNFIDRDPRRFYVRVQDATRNRDRNAKERITARLATLKPDNTEDDDFTDFQLEETGNDTGVFVSKSHLLMSEDVPNNADDDHAAHDGFAGAVADDAAGDRTHRTTVDGFVRGLYRASDTASCSNTIPVCRRDPMPAMDERRVLNVQIYVFNEPWQDVGYDDDNNPATPNVNTVGTFDFKDMGAMNGRHDPGEPSEPFMDISGGAAAFGNAGSWGPIWTDAQVSRTMTYTRAYLASACIRLVEQGRTSVNPKGMLFLHFPGFFDDFPDDDGATGTPSRDESDIQANHRSAANLNAGDGDDIVDIYFVAPFTAAGGAYASQFRPASVAAQGLNARLINQVHIGLNSIADNVPFAPVHELMHQLTNRGDVGTPDHIYFPATGAGMNDGTTVLRKRRMTSAIETDARTPRPAGNMGPVGNRLLRDP